MGLEQHFKEVPDGAFWVTGKQMKAFRDALIADRARLAETSGTEEARENGRFFIVAPGGSSATIDLDVSVNGVIHTAHFVGSVD